MTNYIFPIIESGTQIQKLLGKFANRDKQGPLNLIAPQQIVLGYIMVNYIDRTPTYAQTVASAAQKGGKPGKKCLAR